MSWNDDSSTLKCVKCMCVRACVQMCALLCAWIKGHSDTSASRLAKIGKGDACDADKFQHGNLSRVGAPSSMRASTVRSPSSNASKSVCWNGSTRVGKSRRWQSKDFKFEHQKNWKRRLSVGALFAFGKGKPGMLCCPSKNCWFKGIHSATHIEARNADRKFRKRLVLCCKKAWSERELELGLQSVKLAK